MSGKPLKRQRRNAPEKLINRAAASGDLAEVRRLLKAGIDVNAREDYGGFRPLISAAANSQLSIVKYLIRTGAQIDAIVMDEFPTNYQGATALMMGCFNGHRKVVEELIKAGADINKNITRDKSPNAITYAARQGHLDIVRVLLKEGSLLPSFALYEPVNHKRAAVVEELLKAGADATYRTESGEGLVACACTGSPKWGANPEDQVKIIKLLLAAGADINAGDEVGSTALHEAALAENEPLVKYLIQAGANVNAQTISGSVPLRYAVLTRHGVISPASREIARALVQAGADPAIKDSEGETPLTLAKPSKDKELLRILTSAR
jgi:ankyrin repeat protein